MTIRIIFKSGADIVIKCEEFEVIAGRCWWLLTARGVSCAVRLRIGAVND